MARATFVKKARKDIAGTDIKAGDSYYWWKFRYGGKRFSKQPPKRSQLTQSGFLGSLYDLQDRIGELSCSDIDTFESEKEDILSEIEQLKDQCQESLDNMPEHLQESSSSGEMLTQRIEALESWYDEINSVEVDFDFETEMSNTRDEMEKEEGETDEEYESRIEEKMNETCQEKIDEALDELRNANCDL